MDKDRGYRALVVDDDPSTRLSLEHTLPEYGIRVETASDGVMALNRFRTGRYDVLITDLRMPRMHGHRLVAEVMEQSRPPLIIVLTAVAEAKLVEDLYRRGVTEVVLKPLVVDIFAVKVRALLERTAPRGGVWGDSAAVARNIEETTAGLEKQLASVRASFEETISSLRERREQLEAGYLGSLRVFANMVSEAAQAGGSHVTRVESLSAAIARRLQIAGDDLLDIQIAALLHDIGQFGMPPELRAKAPGQLTPEERPAYEKYPLAGAALLSGIPNAEAVVTLVEAHAENFDGSGFPNGRAGSDIPLGARIIRVADGYETACAHASSENGVKRGLNHLREGRGTLYDPRVVDAALDHLSSAAASTPDHRTVSADELRPGMQLARNVYDGEGRYLARQGTIVTDNLAVRLRALLGRGSVEVFEPDAESV